MTFKTFVMTDEWRVAQPGDVDDKSHQVLRRDITGQAILTPVFPEGLRVDDDPRAWMLLNREYKCDYHLGRLVGPDGLDGVRLVGWVDDKPVAWRVRRHLRFGSQWVEPLKEILVAPVAGTAHLPDVAPMNPADIEDLPEVRVDISELRSAKEGVAETRANVAKVEELVRRAAASADGAASSEQAAAESAEAIGTTRKAVESAQKGAELARDEALAAIGKAKTGTPSGGWTRDTMSRDILESLSRADTALVEVPTATAQQAGAVKLSGDLAGTWDAPEVPGLARKMDKMPVSSSATGNSLAQRTSSGALKTATPTYSDEAATKLYVDQSVDRRVSLNALDYEPGAYTVARRDGNGALKVGEPTRPSHAATKAYVDRQVQNTTLALTSRIDQAAAKGAIPEIIKRVTGLKVIARTRPVAALWGPAEVGLETPIAPYGGGWKPNRLVAVAPGTYRITIAGNREGSSGKLHLKYQHEADGKDYTVKTFEEKDASASFVVSDVGAGREFYLRWEGIAGKQFDYEMTLEWIG